MSKPKNDKPATPVATESLYGSSVLPATIDLGHDVSIALGDLVAVVHAASNMSVEQWNALPEAERESLLAAAVEAARAQAAEAAGKAGGKDDGKKDAKAKAKVAGLRITARQAGFRRAGRAWSTTPTDVPAKELSKDQIAALRAESNLIVEDIEI